MIIKIRIELGMNLELQFKNMSRTHAKSRMIFVYALVEQVESKLEALPSVLFVVRFYEFLLSLYFILRSSIINVELNASNIFNPGFTNADFYLNYQQVSEVILFAAAIVTTVFFLLISLTQVGGRRFQKDLLIWVCLFIFLFLRITYVFVINQTLNTFLKINQYPNFGEYRYILIVPIFIFVLYSTIVNRVSYIYGYFHPLLFAIHNLDPTNYGLISIFFVMFVGRFIYDRGNPDNFYVNTAVMVIIFSLLQQFKEDIQYVQFCFLLFFMLTCLLHLFWKSKRITIFSEKKNSTRKAAQLNKKLILHEYFQYIKNKKESVMKIQDELFVESILLDEYQQCPDNLVEKLKQYTTGQEIVDWTINDHLKFLITQTQIYHTQTKTKQSQITLFSYKLQDVRLHYNNLLQISQRFYEESIFKLQKYQLYKSMIKLQSWFKKFKNETVYVVDSIETDKMVQKFYATLQTLLKLFLDIWGAIKKEVIDFSIIQPLYIDAIAQYTFLEKSLVNIRKRVKCNNQIQKFNQLSDLLQLKVLSKQNLKLLSIMDDQREDQAPFLRISKRKIMYSSYKFNNRFHYTDSEIIGVDIDDLLPESFRKSFISDDQESDEGVHIKLKQFHSILLNGKGCLEFVKISPYIELDFFGQITYMVFFAPQTNPCSSFVLYSIETDIIQQLSNGFLELFGLQCKDVHNTVTGKEAFQQFDFSSKKSQEQLSKEGDIIQTNISVFQFKSTIVDRFNKISVTLKVVHIFDFNGSVRLLLQVKHLTADYYKNMIPGMNLFIQNFIPSNTNPNTSNPKLQSKKSLVSDQSSENKRFLADLVEKKQTFNRDKSKNNFLANHWKSILRCGIFIGSLIVVSIIFFYGSQWYLYMQYQILELNQKIANLVTLFQNQFILDMLKKWPSPYMPSSERQTLITNSYTSLATSIDKLYFSIVKSLKDLTMPMMQRFSGGVNPGIKIAGSDTNLLDIISNSYLIYSQDFVGFIVEKYSIVTDLINSAPNIQDNFYNFRVWMDVCLITCIVTLIVLILLRVYQIYEQKVLEKILEDIQMLFSFLKDEQIDICTQSIEKTIQQFAASQDSNRKKDKQKSKAKNKIQKRLRCLKNDERAPFIQKKTSKTSGASTKSYIKFIVYNAMMVAFFGFLMSYVISVKQEIPNIIKYQNEIQIAVRKTQTNLVNSYYYMIKQKIGEPIPLKLNNLFSTTLIKNDYLIPTQFKQFYGEIWDILNQDICLISQPQDLTRCKASILSKGLVNTLDLNLANIRKFSIRGLDLMFSDGLYDQLTFLRKYLIRKMQNILNLYFQEMKDYLSYRYNLYFMIVVVAVVIILASIFLIWVDYRDQINRNSICKSLFNIFPESFFLKPQIKAYLEETNLIQRILKF